MKNIQYQGPSGDNRVPGRVYEVSDESYDLLIQSAIWKEPDVIEEIKIVAKGTRVKLIKEEKEGDS